MNKQTNAQGTLKRGKGKYKGDEDKLKSSTQNPEKELRILPKVMYNYEIYNYLNYLYSKLITLRHDKKIKKIRKRMYFIQNSLPKYKPFRTSIK